MVTIKDISRSGDDVRRVLYVLMAGGEGGGPSARAARHAQNEELAKFFRKVQEEVVEAARERLLEVETEREKVIPQHQADEGTRQDEFAERAARRLESVADRLEQQSTGIGVEDRETLARARELRVAAFMVRDEAKAVAREAALRLLRCEAALARSPGARQSRTPS